MQAFHEDKLEEAESWMAQAFRFSNLSSALQPYREDLNEGYETTIKMITSSRTPQRRAPDVRPSEVVNGSPDLGSRYGS